MDGPATQGRQVGLVSNEAGYQVAVRVSRARAAVPVGETRGKVRRLLPEPGGNVGMAVDDESVTVQVHGRESLWAATPGGRNSGVDARRVERYASPASEKREGRVRPRPPRNRTVYDFCEVVSEVGAGAGGSTGFGSLTV